MDTCVCVCVVKIDSDSEYLRRVTGKLLKDAIIKLESGVSQSELRGQLKYFMRLPDPKTHVSHVLNEVLSLLCDFHLANSHLSCHKTSS